MSQNDFNFGERYAASLFFKSGITAPPLIDEVHGYLNTEWVAWFSKANTLTVEQTVRVGIARMIELQQKALQFQLDFITHPERVTGYYSYASAMDDQKPVQPTAQNDFRNWLADTTGVNVMEDEPSLWYEGVGVENPWTVWAAVGERAKIFKDSDPREMAANCQEVIVSRCKGEMLEHYQRVVQGLPKPPLLTSGNYISLLAVIYSWFITGQLRRSFLETHDACFILAVNNPKGW